MGLDTKLVLNKIEGEGVEERDEFRSINVIENILKTLCLQQYL